MAENKPVASEVPMLEMELGYPKGLVVIIRWRCACGKNHSDFFSKDPKEMVEVTGDIVKTMLTQRPIYVAKRNLGIDPAGES